MFMQCPGVSFRNCGNSMYQNATIKMLFPTRETLVSPGLPCWLRRICLQCRRPGFNPWVGKISWRREWQLTLEFLPEESHEQRILVSHSLWGGKQSDTTELPTTSLSMSKGKNKFWKKSNWTKKTLVKEKNKIKENRESVGYPFW